MADTGRAAFVVAILLVLGLATGDRPKAVSEHQRVFGYIGDDSFKNFVSKTAGWNSAASYYCDAYFRDGRIIFVGYDKTNSCKVLCLNKCTGEMYFTTKLFLEDCTFTTLAVKGLQTLSVTRQNYSDFITTLGRYTLHHGDRVGRMQAALKVKWFRGPAISPPVPRCAVPPAEPLPSEPCENPDFYMNRMPSRNFHNGYKFSWWTKFLILIKWYTVEEPVLDTGTKDKDLHNDLSVLDYKYNFLKVFQ